MKSMPEVVGQARMPEELQQPMMITGLLNKAVLSYSDRSIQTL